MSAIHLELYSGPDQRHVFYPVLHPEFSVSFQKSHEPFYLSHPPIRRTLWHSGNCNNDMLLPLTTATIHGQNLAIYRCDFCEYLAAIPLVSHN